MRTESLRMFLDVARTGSLHASAANFFISQPALGKAIAALEKELGYPLFERSHSGMQLTGYGQATAALVQKALFTLDGIEDIRRHYRSDAQKNLSGTLDIVAVPTIGTGIMPAILPSFAQALPNVKLSIAETNSELGLRQIYQGLCDLAFLVDFDENADYGADFTAELLWKEQLYAFMRKDNVLAGKASISLKSLKNYPLAIMSYDREDKTVTDALEDLLESNESLEIAFRSNNHHMLQGYVLGGNAIGLTHIANTIDREYNRALLPDAVYIPVTGCPTSRFVALYRSNSPKMELIRIVIDALLEVITRRKGF